LGTVNDSGLTVAATCHGFTLEQRAKLCGLSLDDRAESANILGCKGRVEHFPVDSVLLELQRQDSFSGEGFGHMPPSIRFLERVALCLQQFLECVLGIGDYHLAVAYCEISNERRLRVLPSPFGMQRYRGWCIEEIDSLAKQEVTVLYHSIESMLPLTKNEDYGPGSLTFGPGTWRNGETYIG